MTNNEKLKLLLTKHNLSNNSEIAAIARCSESAVEKWLMTTKNSRNITDDKLELLEGRLANKSNPSI